MSGSRVQKPWTKITQFAFMSLVCFALGAMLIFFMVWQGEKLILLGLTGRLYYIILLPLGLSVSGFLFGVFQSYAQYKGHQFSGTLTLGGPIVGFLLVIILGFVLVRDPATFAVSVYVHGPHGHHDLVLRNSGEVYVDLDGDRRHVKISDQGEAVFQEVPANFRSRAVEMTVVSDTFEPADPDKKVKLDGQIIYLAVQRKAGRIFGHVESTDKVCKSGAEVRVHGIRAPVNPDSGEFALTIPGDIMDQDLVLEASAPGCNSESYSVTANSNAVEVALRRLTLAGAKGRYR